MSNVEIVKGQVVARPMGGAIEDMLKVLEDPKNMKFESALFGLVAKYQAEGPKFLRPLKDRFRKMLNDKSPERRQLGVWGLGHIGDGRPRAAAHQGGCSTPDEGVVNEARIGLQLMSRKVEGFGPPDKATPEQKLAAAKRWQAWFQAVKRRTSTPRISPSRRHPGRGPHAAPAAARRPATRPRPPHDKPSPSRRNPSMDLNELSAAEATEPAAEAAPTARKAEAAPPPVEKPYEPMVHGESAYDRVTSMLIVDRLRARRFIVGWLVPGSLR